MKHIYFVKDLKSNTIRELYFDVNLACVVRTIRGYVDEDKLRVRFDRLSVWDDSILCELTEDDKGVFHVTNTFKLHDLTQLKVADPMKKHVEIKQADVLEGTINGKN